MSRFSLFQAVDAADKAWMSEVVAVFGESDADGARYHGRATGELGSRLRDLYDSYLTARDAYRSYRH